MSVWWFASAQGVGGGVRVRSRRPHVTTHYSVSCKCGLESGIREKTSLSTNIIKERIVVGASSNFFYL